MGTSRAYFEHYRYGERRLLAFSDGGPFEDLYDAVLGADVAESLGYAVGDAITVAHVARMASGATPQSGAISKKGFPTSSCPSER